MISELLGRPGLFYRSVALERDAKDPSAGRSFVLTPWLERGASEVLSGMKPGSTRRAWRILGDFGVGKSALALAIVQMLDPRIADPSMPLAKLAHQCPRMYPLLVTGSRLGFSETLLAAIAAAVDGDADVSAADATKLRDLRDPFEAILCLRDALRASGKFDGLLLVIDEMGKFLETAGEAEGFDIFRLQSLAETAARSGDAPLGVILILHKGFQSYAEDWRTSRRTEWEKVAERFEELVFDHPLSHTAALLSSALAVDTAALPTKIRKECTGATRRVRALGWLGPKSAAEELPCWPIHPAAVPVMARFFAAYGQNERSLFGFAQSEEPNSLRAFAAATRVGDNLYDIAQFFDFIASSFGHRLTSRSGAGDWSRIEAVLDRAADSDPTETAVLKTVGVLNLIDAPDLAATAATVAACLDPAHSQSDVEGAIARLTEGGLLFQRPGRPDLRLWTSRRVDLSRIWAEAEEEIEARSVLRELPRHLASLPIQSHVLARRHSVMTGTNRRFALRCTHASSLSGYSGHRDADGGVTAILCGSEEDRRVAHAWSIEATGEHKTLIALVSPPLHDLAPAMIDLLRHRWVITHAAALQEDAHALAEIERGMADLETRLVGALEALLGLRGKPPTEQVDRFHAGAKSVLHTPIHTEISDLCDALYELAPLVENELVNRHSLTSAGAGARQRLIEQMFASAADPQLGFKAGKNPPERALYLSLMRKGRLHREEEGRWIIAPPRPDDDPLRLLPAIDAIFSLLTSDTVRIPLIDFYTLVEEKPYGVRRGLAPILLATALVAAGHRVSLFERGTYCTKLDGAAFMRILKSPEHFELQWAALVGVRADVFQRLAEILHQPVVESGIRAVVDPLIRFAVDLPFHVQHSATLDGIPREVRKKLTSARSPIDLLFVDLPLACGEAPFGTDDATDDPRAASFARTLDSAITELRACYPKLLETMRGELLAGLNAEARAHLGQRATQLNWRVKEQQLRTFVIRVADDALPDDPWIEAIGGAVIGKPPARWLAQDVELWQSRLANLIGQFQRVEATAFGCGQQGGAAVRISLTRTDGEERAVIVDTADLNEDERIALHGAIRLGVDAGLSLDKLAALVSLRAMEEGGDAEAQGIENADRGRA
ncbi:hypothetical protein [Sphingopyxis sp.]|uniref:hypothetical protein n=1 Tax=Sphingopyxis sp. TaxID=1908224 RepID=UPI003BAA716B